MLLLVLVLPSIAHAQAWVGEKKSLDASLDYNFGFSSKVIGSTVTFPNGGSQSHTITLGAEYVPIEKLALDASIPFLAIKYTGDKMAYPHPGGGKYDDGAIHGTLTDFRFGGRYMVLAEPFALSPILAVSIPMQHYETVGNAVAGRHLKEAHIGLSVGKVIADAAYLQATYELTLAEKYDRTPDTEKYSQTYSDFAIAAGYGLMDGKLDLNVGFNGRIHHDGIDFDDYSMWTPNEQRYHDPILKEKIFLVGAGAGYKVSETLTASLAARIFVAGANTQNGSVIALGLGWSPEP